MEGKGDRGFANRGYVKGIPPKGRQKEK